MLRFNRLAGLGLQARFLQQIASRAASTSSARIPSENVVAEKHVLTVEELETKYKDALQKNQMNNIYETIERIDLSSGQLSGKVLDKTAYFLADKKTNLANLSDRDFSLVFTAYGEKSDSISKAKRTVFLNKTLEALQRKGVQFGPEGRTALFTAKVDNGEVPSVVEELQAWEKAGLTPTEEVVRQFARVYALEGNSKGVVDIMNHMRSTGMTVDENTIGALLYSLAVSGHPDQAEIFAKKFANSVNIIALKAAIAEGLLKTGKVEEALSSLASIPQNAKLHNNKHVVRILCTMIEGGVSDAFSKLSPYLQTNKEETTLAEKNNNGYVLSRVRSARSERNLIAMLELYGIMNLNYKNTRIEENAQNAFGHYLKEKKQELSDILLLLEKLAKTTTIENSELFLLESAMNTPNRDQILHHCKDNLGRILNVKPDLKIQICKELGHELTNKSLSIVKRADILTNIAMVLFTKTKESDPTDAYRILYGLADVEYIIAALKNVTDDRVARETVTAAIHQILQARDDPLKLEKLEKLIASDVVTSVNISNLQKQLRYLVTGKEDRTRQHLIAVKIIALAFNKQSSFGPKFLQTLLTDSNTETDHLRKFVDLLEQEPKVRLSRDEVGETRTKMAESGLTDRTELLERLKAQGQTYARWLASSIPSLEEELTTMKSSEKTSKGAVHTCLRVLLAKLLKEEKLDFQACERALRAIAEQADASSSLKQLSSKLWDKTFIAALKDAQDDVVRNLWEIKTTFSAEAGLTYISLLFIKGNLSEADVVCSELIQSAQTITGGALESAGKIVSNYDPSRVDELAKYLKEKLHLKDNQSRRIVAEIKNKQLNELFEKNDLEGALQLAQEESKATGLAFGQYELFKASFISKNADATQKTYNMVMETHNKNIAILDLAFAMLEHGISHGENLLRTNKLNISSKKLEFFVMKAVDKNRPDMLHSLFTGLFANGAASLTDLNKLILQLTKLYYKSNAFDKLDKLEGELRELSFPTEEHIKKIFNMQRQKRGEVAQD